jgi:hypothetical protein
MASTPGTSKGTLARVGLTMKGKTFGYADADYPGLRCQSATLTNPTIKETTRVPGSDAEVNHIRGIAGGTFPMTIYMNYRSPMQGTADLELFEGDQVPIVYTRDSVYADPTNALNQPPNGAGHVYGVWVNISGLPHGGEQNTGFNVDISGEVSGCKEIITDLPAAPATPGGAGGVGAFTFNFDGDATQLQQNAEWNPSDTSLRVVGYILEYKLAADSDWTVAPAAEPDGVTFDITAVSANPSLEFDAMDLPGTLHVLNPGAETVNLSFTADPGTYDVRATAVGHFILKSAPVVEAALIVT